MSGTSLNALLFLVSTLFDLYIFVLILRLFLAWAGAEYRHPITQLVVQLTSWIVRPLKKALPDVKGIETATIVLIFIVEIIKFLVICLMSFGFPSLIGLFILAFADMIKLFLEILIFTIILEFIVTLIQPQAPVNQVLDLVTAPLMKPLQRVLPIKGIAGLCLSVVAVVVVLWLLIIIVVDPLLAIGLGIAVG